MCHDIAITRLPFRPFSNVYIWLRPYDLDLEAMTSIPNLDLDVLTMYLCTKNKVSRLRLLEVRARTGQTDIDRQTDAAELITTSHSRVLTSVLALTVVETISQCRCAVKWL